MENYEEKAKAINSKLDSIEQSMAEKSKLIEDLSKKGEAVEKLENEVKELNEKHSKQLDESVKAFEEKFKKQQEHLDKLDIAGQKSAKPLTLADEIKSNIETRIEDIKLASKGKIITFETKADMTTGSNLSGDVPAFTKLGGVYFDPSRAQHIRQFLNVIPISGDTLYFDQETAYTDNVAVRAEGAAAGQTDFTITEQSKAVENISTYLTLTKQMLGDAAFLSAYINNRIGSKLMAYEDTQILYGTGASNQLTGITTVASAYSDLLADSTVNRYDVLFNATINAINNEYRPTLIVLHPTDYMNLLLEKDSQGAYLFPASLASGQGMFVNGARVIASTAMTAGDFVVGDFTMGCTFGQREGINFTIGNQHSDNLIKGKVTIFAEERVVLGVHNTNAFVYGDFASALAQGTA